MKCDNCGSDTALWQSVNKPLLEVGRLRIEWRTDKEPVCVECAIESMLESQE